MTTRSRGPHTYTITEQEADQRLDRWLRAYCPTVPLGQLHKGLRTGQIRVDGKRVKPSDRLTEGMCVRLPPWIDSASSGSSDVLKDKTQTLRGLSDTDRALLKSWILQETQDLLILNKPHGLACQGGSKTIRHLDGLLQALAAERGAVGPDGKGYRLVHRLDRDTSGVLLVAKTAAAARRYAAALQQKQVRKTYLALLIGVPIPTEGILQGRIAKRRTGTHEHMAPTNLGDKNGQYAETEYQVLDTLGETLTLVALRPITGRTHQLRVHMEMLGTPILGDPRYGHRMEEGLQATCDANRTALKNLGLDTNALHLHAWHLSVPTLPSGGASASSGNTGKNSMLPAVAATAFMPEAFASAIKAAGLDVPHTPEGAWAESR